MEHSERYRRAREFYDVVTGLWDSWADDAFIRDVENGIYFDSAKLHVLGHKGEYFSVRGPLNIARPVQGWPVIVQAGASEAGRQLAAETAEAVVTAQSSIEVARAFYADVKGRAEKAGRSRDHLKILPGCFVVVGDTVEEARAKRAKLDSLVHYANAMDRSRSRSATTHRNSIPTVRCRKFPKAMLPRAAGSERSISLGARTSPFASSLSGSAAMAAWP